MTDQERARSFWRARTLFDTEDDTSALVREFAAVRMDERRAIAALLRKRESDPYRSATGKAALHEAADAIERGEHGS